MEATKVEVITIEESPPPTRRAVTPITCVRRAGSRRLPMHRRALTCKYNPCLRNHCGFQVVLKAAGQNTNMKNVDKLRHATAAELEKAYAENGSVHGISVQALVDCSGCTLDQYLRGLRTTLWASEVELHFAAKIKKVSILYKDDKKVTKVGEGRLSGVAVLRKEHFMLHKAHRRVRCVNQYREQIRRGGMRQSTWAGWQGEASSPGTSSEVKVRLEGHHEAVICVTESDTIEILKAKLANMFDVDIENVIPMDADGDELPDWAQCPKEITAQIKKPKPNKLPLSYQGIRVDLWLQDANDEEKIKQEVGRLFNVIPALLIMKVGNVIWKAHMRLDEEEVIDVDIINRGGMQRSVSTTLRWDQGSGSTDSPASRHFPTGEKLPIKMGNRPLSTRQPFLHNHLQHRRKVSAGQFEIRQSWWAELMLHHMPIPMM